MSSPFLVIFTIKVALIVLVVICLYLVFLDETGKLTSYVLCVFAFLFLFSQLMCLDRAVKYNYECYIRERDKIELEEEE